VVAEVLDQVQVGKVTRSWSAAGTVAESPDQDRLHRLVEAGVLRSSKEPPPPSWPPAHQLQRTSDCP
jgi:hypothetical protein